MSCVACLACDPSRVSVSCVIACCVLAPATFIADLSAMSDSILTNGECDDWHGPSHAK